MVAKIIATNLLFIHKPTDYTTKAAQHSIRSENLQHPTGTIGQD